MSDSAEAEPQRSAPVWPLVVWWWDQAADRDVPPTHAICWVELVASEERRAGTVQISKQTAHPHDLDDPAVRVELHHYLERRLGTTIQVDHAQRHLDHLQVSRRLAARGHRISTLTLQDFQDNLLGGVAVRSAEGPSLGGEVVIRRGLAVNARDEVLLWAERTLAEAAAASGPGDLEALDWTTTRSCGWQQLLYAAPDEPAR